MKQLTFDDVCKQLKRNTNFSEMFDGLNALSGAAILLLGIRSASGDVSAFVNALAIKDQLTNIGKCILDKIIKEKTNECDKRIKQMQWAYSIIYYTAFFDVLDEQMPKQMREAIRLSLEEKKGIFENINLGKRERDDSLMDTEIFYPNIVYGYAKIEMHLEKLYASMCVGLTKFVQMLSFEETSNEQTILKFNDIVEKLPKFAIERFKGQYLYLASNFNEFYIYMQIEEEKRKTIHIEELYKNIISIGCDTNKKMDVGLEYLEKILLNLPEKIHEDKVNNIVNALIEKYKGDIDKPIIDSKSNDEKLRYPSINKAFIPQSYKILEYSGVEKLEKKETWTDKEECTDMDSFWAKYYVSHYSLDNLLLILGEPGGGKSLLTKIVCARMSDSNNIFVRIPLREVSVEKEIEDIVCEQIQKDGDATEQLPTYKWFAENFKYNPITLVFDGYDEVLQATGGVYRNLLKKILKFQDQCSERHRPVRIVVTSRETLIDKADIPIGTIVLKLLEFNEKQREEWIKIWNQNNDEIFKKEHLNPFMLPRKNSSIDELSRQPLLLLMLAIYDANLEERINSLGQKENLNRTKLYNELLRRFIRRELRKGARGDEVPYEESTEKDKELMIDLEMEKLGIAALGMFIRGRLSLKVREMERDLEYMESQTPTYKNVGKMLSNAEEFFGSFFFIHDSQSGNAETEDKEIAFEFLHKTFYEFLVADLVLKYLVKAIDELDALKNSKRCDSYQKAIDDPNHFDKQYYTALMSAYLCTEPEIIEMIVEWKENIINDYFQGERLAYDQIIEELFNKQIEMLCNNIFMPSIWNEQLYDNTIKKSYMQYCATYFMNLLILQTTTKKDSKRTIEKSDWIYISQFWKMNIQEDFLLKFTSLFSITNEQGKVCVRKKQIFNKVEQKQLLEKQMDIFNFLQDDISYSLYCLHGTRVHYSTKQKCRHFLMNTGIEIEFETLIGEIKEYILGSQEQFSLVQNINSGVHILFRTRVDVSLVLEWLLCINTCLDRRNPSLWESKGIENELIEVISNMYPQDIQIISETLKCWQRMGDMDVLKRNNRIVLDNMRKIIYGNAQLSLEYLDLLEQFVSIEERETIIEKLRNLCDDRVSIQSADLIARVLKLFYLLNAENELDDLMQFVVKRAVVLFERSPKALIDILKLCIVYGRTDCVKYLVKIGFDNFDNFFREIEIETDFLEAIHMTGEVNQYTEQIEYYINSRIRYITRKNPKTAIRLFKLVSLYGKSYKYKKVVDLLYGSFDYIFEQEPKDAIGFLKLTNKAIPEIRLHRALQYSLSRFNFLVVKSIEAAMDLLMLCLDEQLDVCRYIQLCFAYFLYNNLVIDTIKMFELIDSLGDKELETMGEFFGARYLYIVINFPALAEKIAAVYYNSKWKRELLDVLANCKHNYIVDKDYILHLEQMLQQ